MAKRRTTAADELAAAIEPKRQTNWFDRLPTEHKADLADIRQRYQSGGYTQTATFIFRWCKERYSLSIGQKHFWAWLTGRD